MNEKNHQEEPMPPKKYSYEEVFLDIPLYKELLYDKDQQDSVLDNLKNFKFTFDCYCLECESQSVFRRKSPNVQYPQTAVLGTYEVIFGCSRDRDHELIFIFYFGEEKFQKIGQIPSIADLQKAEIQKYHIILGDEKYREFSRAIGLVAHGVGIGSFVYLRRIFESLIEEAHEIASGQSDWDEDGYSDSRMEEKITKLKDYLPEFLVKNRKIYSILSKGIHELSEEECLTHFEALKVGIEIILDQKLEEKKREEKIKGAQISLEAITNSLKNKV